jgi:hypothetical protein
VKKALKFRLGLLGSCRAYCRSGETIVERSGEMDVVNSPHFYYPLGKI